MCLACINLLPRDLHVTSHNFQYLCRKFSANIKSLCIEEEFRKIKLHLEKKCAGLTEMFNIASIKQGDFKIILSSENEERIKKQKVPNMLWISPDHALIKRRAEIKRCYGKKYGPWLKWHAETHGLEYDFNTVVKFHELINLERAQKYL